MANTASKVIELAKKEIGYLEKASNSNLDSKTANAGSGNYTKYARDLYNAGYYNGNKNGYAWCDVFVDWLFFKAFGKKVGQEMQCQTGDLGAGCYYSARYYKNQDRFYSEPKVGDQIFFADSDGDAYHTGIVIGVTNSTVTTIEGNTSSASGVVANGGAVAKKSYSRSYSRIHGYGRPKYDPEVEDNKGESSSSSNKTTNGGTCMVTLPVLRKGANSGYVKTLQILLNKYDLARLDEDGIFGDGTYAAVKAYQKRRGLDVDGIVGAKTWVDLLK